MTLTAGRDRALPLEAVSSGDLGTHRAMHSKTPDCCPVPPAQAVLTGMRMVLEHWSCVRASPHTDRAFACPKNIVQS